MTLSGFWPNAFMRWGIANEEQLKAVDEAAKQEVAGAVKFADESPSPDTATLFDDIYYEPDHHEQDEKVVPLEKTSSAGERVRAAHPHPLPH